MKSLNTLSNEFRPRKKRLRVGRGIGSGVGKTCGRGQKGAGARSGYKRRERYEGGQLPLYRKLPTRGFSNARFQRKLECVNLHQIDTAFEDGETVSIETLRQRGFGSGPTYGLKVLGDGELTKKVRIEADAYSRSAQEKLQNANIEFVVIGS